MPKDEWGVKRVCPKCSTRFYDLKKDPMTCPACEHTVTLDVLNGGKPKPVAVEKAPKAKPAEEVKKDADDLDTDDDADIDLDADVLDDEDDDTVTLDEIADVPAKDDEN